MELSVVQPKGATLTLCLFTGYIHDYRSKKKETGMQSIEAGRDTCG